MTRTGVRVPPVLACSVSVLVSTCCGRDGGGVGGGRGGQLCRDLLRSRAKVC